MSDISQLNTILKAPTMVIAEGPKPLEGRDVFKQLLKGFFGAGVMYVGMGTGFLLLSDWQEQWRSHESTQPVAEVSSSVELKTAMEKLQFHLTTLSGANDVLRFAIDKNRPELIVLASQRLVMMDNLEDIVSFQDSLKNSGLFEDAALRDILMAKEEETDWMLQNVSPNLRQAVHLARVSDSSVIENAMQEVREKLIFKEPQEVQEKFWENKINEWINTPYWENQSSLFLFLKDRRMFADLNQDRYVDALQDGRVISANVVSWVEEKERMGFNPSQAWVLWRLESVFGPRQNTVFHPDLADSLKQSWWAWQQKVQGVQNTEDLAALLKDIETSNDFWINTVKLDDGFQKVLWNPENHGVIPSSFDDLKSSLLIESQRIPGQLLLREDLPTMDVESALKETGVASLTVPWYALQLPNYDAVMVQFLLDSNQGLQQTTQWEGPVLGLANTVHYRWMPERSKEWNGGYFFEDQGSGQFFIQTKVSQATYGPVFHEWFHALDAKLASPGEHFASEDVFVSSIMSRRLKEISSDLSETLALPFTGLMQWEDPIAKHAESFGEEKMLALMENIRKMPVNPIDQKNVLEEAQWRGVLDEEAFLKWSTALNLPHSEEYPEPSLRLSWSLAWDRFLLERWARVEQGNFMFRSIWYDKEENTLAWKSDGYWGRPAEIAARAFESYGQTIVPYDRFWRFDATRDVEGFYSAVMPSPAETEAMAPSMAEFFNRLTPWWTLQHNSVQGLSLSQKRQARLGVAEDDVLMGSELTLPSQTLLR